MIRALVSTRREAAMFGGAALVAAVVATLVVPNARPAQARDFGQMGQAWPIAEPDLLETIRARLMRMEGSGETDRINAMMVEKTKARVRRPKPVDGIAPTEETRRWAYDPVMVVDRDIRDAKGNIIAAAGSRVNPLDLTPMTRELVFINGDDKSEVEWALSRGDDRKLKVVLVGGSPFDLMGERQRRFFFDQTGVLTARFGIRHTPAVVRQTGKLLEVSEVAIARKPGA